MSNSQVFNIMAGGYYDQLCEGFHNFSVGSFDPTALQGSLNNPLQALRLLCIDVESEMSIEAEELSRVTGVPSRWFEADRLVGEPDAILQALGRVTLIFLSCLRNEGLKYGFQVDATENALNAEKTLLEVLELNKKFSRK